MLAGLVAALLYIVTVQVLGAIDEIGAWLADAELRAITRPFWHHLLVVGVTTANLVLLVGALAAILARRDPQRSRRWLLGAFGLYLPLQVLPRLVPLAWQFDLPPEARDQAAAIFERNAPVMAAAAWIDLAPMVASVFLGVLRAGLRHTVIRPGSSLGPTIAFTSSLQLALVGAMVFASSVQVSTAHWALSGIGLLLLHFAVVAATCFRLARRGGAQGGGRWPLRISALLLFLPGALVLLRGLLDVEVLGYHLLAYGDTAGLIQLGELPEHAVVFAVRTISTAVAANDLLARSGDDDQSEPLRVGRIV